MPLIGLKPSIPISERPEILSLDRSVLGIGILAI
jgi:hypothetical protein